MVGSSPFCHWMLCGTVMLKCELTSFCSTLVLLNWPHLGSFWYSLSCKPAHPLWTNRLRDSSTRTFSVGHRMGSHFSHNPYENWTRFWDVKILARPSSWPRCSVFLWLCPRWTWDNMSYLPPEIPDACKKTRVSPPPSLAGINVEREISHSTWLAKM